MKKTLLFILIAVWVVLPCLLGQADPDEYKVRPHFKFNPFSLLRHSLFIKPSQTTKD